ncbi:MAG: hypothetical protein ACE5FT_02970 [Candidatus Nanoarchaeia archaeon]
MANPLKRTLNKQVPERVRTMDYKLLLTLVEKRNIQTPEQLRDYLAKRESTLKEWIRENKDAGKNVLRRRKTNELKLIATSKTFLKYL